MDNLPVSWTEKRLGEITTKPQYGYTASASAQKKGPKFVRITDITKENIDWETVPYCECSREIFQKYKLEPKDLLFARTGSTGSSILITELPEPAVFASYLIRLKIKKEIEAEYLNHFFKSWFYWKQIESLKVGAVQSGINASVLSSLKIPVPPLVEQRGIVEVLGTVDECIRLTDAVIERAEELKRGLMQQLLTRGIGHTEYKETPLGKIPTIWKIKTLGTVFTIIMGQSPPGNSYHETPIGVPLLNGPAEFGEIYPVLKKWTDKPTKMAFENDVLVCVRGNTTGRINIADQNYCIGRGVAAIREKKGISTSQYTKYVFENIEKKLLQIASGGGSTFPNITKNDLHNYKIPLPVLIEQKKISSILRNADNNIETEKVKLENYKKLKRGLMQLLLSGKIRVELKGDGLHRIGDSREANN